MKLDLFKNIVLGITVAVVFFILIELVLWTTGITPIYERSDLSVGFSGYSPLFQEHIQPDGKEILSTSPNKTVWFNVQRFPAKKAYDVIRVFCLGGSTTYGRPYDDRTSFSAWLRHFLPVIDSSRRWEVINVGGISYASYRVARLMEELVNYEPDIFIVYSGHNEFLESRTYNKLLKLPEFVRSLEVLASRSRIYTFLYDLFYKSDDLLPTEVDALLDRSIGPDDYHRDDELRAAVLEDYENSLIRMTQISEQVGAEMILVAPASNIADFSPFKSEPSPGLSSEEIKWINEIKQEISNYIKKEKYILADSLAKEALSLDDRNADILYMHGKALYTLDSIEKARQVLIRSKDEDVCPLRALSPVRSIVADVAENKNTGFVDYEHLVRENSPNGIPGSDLFLDHVHPTIEGNRLLALAIIDEMKQEGYIPETANLNDTLIEKVSSDLKNSLDDNIHATALRNLSKVLSWAGKHEEAERLVNQAVEMIPDDGETHVQKGRLLWIDGDREGALIHFREAAKLEPWRADVRQGLGVLLSKLGRKDEALIELEEAIRLDPNQRDVHYDIGIVLQAKGRLKDAEKAFRTAIKQDPNHSNAHNNLGIVLAKSGNIEGAHDQFREALRIDPNNEDAAKNEARAKRALSQ